MKQNNFNQINNWDDFKILICNNQILDDLARYMDFNTLQAAIEAINNIDETKQMQCISFFRYVDKKQKQNPRHKLPTSLAGCIYYHRYYDKIKKLNNEELSILAKYSALSSLDEFDELTTIFNKELLSTIASKTKSYERQEDIAIFAYDKIKAGQNQENMIEYIAEAKEKDIVEESRKYQIKVTEGVGIKS